MKTVAIVGTLDTKGVEFAFLKQAIEAEGVATLVIDTGILAAPPFPPEIAADVVAAAGGGDRAALAAGKDRGAAVTVMANGAAEILGRLVAEGRVHGAIGMGGGGGTAIAATAMRSLPVGFPKLIVSTLAAGDTTAIVGVKDIPLMPSVVDVSGITRLSAQIITTAAGAIA